MARGQSTHSRAERAGRGGLGGLSIQSKLLVMLLAVSLISSIIVGAIGFINGRNSLREAAVDQLTTIREMRAAEISDEFSTIRRDAALQSRNLSAQTMSVALNEAFAALGDRPLTDDERGELETYYTDTFIPALETGSGNDYGDLAFIPESAVGQYLQTQYTVKNEDFDADYDALLVANDSGDGTAYAEAAERYGDYFERLISGGGYEDALLLNLEGDVVFSAYKGVELGTNLRAGPYADSALAGAYRDVVATNSVEALTMTDFERWVPSLNVPTMWVVTPIGNDARITGALALEIPLDRINNVMTGTEQWEAEGLGETGEVYAVGRDGLMRSTSRILIEEPENYGERVIAAGTAPTVAERVVAVAGTVGLQPVPDAAISEAQAGRSGIFEGTDYAGSDSLIAYAPLEIEDLDWVVLARIDAAEAFAPVADFTRTVLLSLLGILIGVALLSLLLAQVFTRPIHRLVGAVHRIAAGDLDVRVPQGSRDEFGDLGSAFNDMASSLRVKQELIDEQRAENERLLHAMMPENVAHRYKQGDETIAEAHDNVSVVYAELVGFDEAARGLSGDDEISRLNALMRGFDEAAEKSGVEKIRTLRGGYLASSGLVVPRVDNVRRSVEFAQYMVASVTRFNDQHGTSITLRVGVDTGMVTSGLVGRTSLAYDLWGDAVNLAYRVRSVTGEPGIYVSQAVYDRTHELIEYTEAGTLETHGATETVWRVS